MFREFDIPKRVPVYPRVASVFFQTGTPLGSLSSWGVFALLHHLLVQQAYYMTGGRQWFRNYAILGDDLVIGSSKVASQYRRLLKLIGVEISFEKSITSNNGSLEFASRFLYRGIDVSPISFKALTVARVSVTQTWSFFRRIREFREIRISEFFRMAGAGYRVLAYTGLPFTQLRKLPKRWFRRWLLVHHPRAPGGLPWEWWLAAGRGKPLPVGTLGVLNYQLYESWARSLGPEGWSLDPEACDENHPFHEELTLRPWVSLHLRGLLDVTLRVMKGELIDPYLDYIPVKRDLRRCSSATTSFRWSLSYRLYDRVSVILSQPLPLAIEG